jgi:hypothetical protein
MYHFGTIITVFTIASRFSLFIWIFSENSDLNCRSLKTWKIVHEKISMLLSTSYDRFQERTENFEHHAHLTWPWTCHSGVYKLYKTQTKSENHETYPHVMISYVEAVIKIWKISRKLWHTMCTNLRDPHWNSMISCIVLLGFYTYCLTTFSKHSKFLITVSTYDIMARGQVSWFSEFVCVLYNF